MTCSLDTSAILSISTAVEIGDFDLIGQTEGNREPRKTGTAATKSFNAGLYLDLVSGPCARGMALGFMFHPSSIKHATTSFIIF